MKILFVSVGKRHDAALADSIADFTARVSRYAPVDWKLIPSDQSSEAEGKAILGALDERDFVVLLDERGKEVSSEELAKLLDTRLSASTRRLVFIIGGAYGASELVKGRANSTIALSRLVFPHQLVRLILAEQVYRAFTILKGEKYHHAG